jgi:hypothetical protein
MSVTRHKLHEHHRISFRRVLISSLATSIFAASTPQLQSTSCLTEMAKPLFVSNQSLDMIKYYVLHALIISEKGNDWQ